ncbi:MAG: ferritin-like domain-containing protein [Parafilimonas sp.]|nr:ferritin-like domain-containing protein [Parafilimonas sp.]
MPTIDTLHELLKHELKDLYSAETQLIEALPKMVDAATNGDLRNALDKHLEVTRAQKERLDKIQQLLGEEKAAPEKKGFFANLFRSNEGEEHCKAMEGLIKEGNSLMGEDMTPEVTDAAIIAASQKIEHYEISSYGTARAYALQLNLSDVAKLLETTLNEEYEADLLLTDLALSNVNTAAGAGRSTSTRPAKKANSQTTPKAVKKSAPEKSAPKKAAPKKSSPKKAKASAKNSSPKKSAKKSRR